MGSVVEQVSAYSIRGNIQVGGTGAGFKMHMAKDAFEAGSLLRLSLQPWDMTGTYRQFSTMTTQLFDVVLLDAGGTEVRRWSEDYAFAQTACDWTLEGSNVFDVELSLTDRDGKPLAPGVYTVQGCLVDVDEPQPVTTSQIVVHS